MTSGPPLGRYEHDIEGGLAVRVQLRNLPVQVLAASREHHDELMREFRLMALAGTRSAVPAPTRLLELVQLLGVQYAGATERPGAEIDAAIARGEFSLDVAYVVPSSAAADAQALDAVMSEADEFCLSEQLLTLARSPLMVEFAQWYLRCFVDQVAGADPEPWQGPMTVTPAFLEDPA